VSGLAAWILAGLFVLVIVLFPYRVSSIKMASPGRPAITSNLPRLEAVDPVPVAPVDFTIPLQAVPDLNRDEHLPERRTVYVHVRPESVAQAVTSTAASLFTTPAPTPSATVVQRFRAVVGGTEYVFAVEQPSPKQT